MKNRSDWRMWFLLGISILTTFFAVFFLKLKTDKIAEAEFIFECKEITNNINIRLHSHAQLLRSGAAFFGTADTVSREAWHSFIEKSRVDTDLPGILGTGFSLLIPKENLDQHIELIKKHKFPNYKVWPEHDRETYTSIVFLEPFSGRNLRAFGYDMMTESVRREAMERARDFDVAALSGKVLLVQETETDVQAGNLMYVPVYQKGARLTTIEQRREAILGWVYSPYRMNDLVAGILDGWQSKEKKLNLEIYDGEECSVKSLLFQSYGQNKQKDFQEVRFSLKKVIGFNGHIWTLSFVQERGSIFTNYMNLWIVLFGGILISVLIFLLSRSLTDTKHKAQEIARTLTAELKESERLLKESQKIANLGSYSLDITTGIWTSSKILDDIFGIDENYIHSIEGWSVLVHPDFKEEMEDYLTTIVIEHKFFDKEYKIIRNSDKKERWIHGLGKLEFDNNHKPIKLIGTISDITDRKLAEERLHLSREQYRSLFENSPLGIYQTTPDGRIVNANPTLLKMLEFDSLDELQKRDIEQEGYSTESSVSRKQFVELIERDGYVKGLEETWTTRSGKIIPIRENARVIKGKNGQILFYEGTVEDITERKLAEREIQNITSRLQLATSAANIGIWDLDIINNTLIWDATMYNLYGISSETFTGAYEAWEAALHPDDLTRGQEEIQMALKGEKEFDTEFRVFWPDNSTRHLKASGIVSRDALGNPIRMLGINMDITDRKRAEDEIIKHRENLEVMVAERTRDLTISEQKLKKSLKDISDYKFALDESSLVAITDNKGVINFANDNFCRTSKFSSEELIGKTHQIINSGYHSEPFFIDLWRTISDGKVWRGEIKNKAKDGSFYWVDSTIVPFLDEKGKPYQYVAVRFDITTKKVVEDDLIKAKEEADSANRAKSEFLANMSHEIRTPMNSVIGFSELLAKSVKEEKQQSQVESIRSSGKILLKIINDILDLSKVEAGKIEIILVPIDLQSLIGEIENMFIQKVNEKGIHFAVEYESVMPKLILLDEIRVRQILFNLIGNAIKFTDKGHVVLSVDVRKNSKEKKNFDIVFYIEDTGIGIPLDQQELIFQPFSQQIGQSAKYGGTGLGLPITKKLIEKMGGTIKLESEVGKGCNITVLIPNISIPETEVEATENLFDPNIIKFNNAKILLVDDNELNRNLIKDILEHSELEIFEAENGEEAIQSATKNQPDLILMDLRMPVMDGYEATEILKQTKKTESIPVIAISASAKKVIFGNRTKEIFSEFLMKPLDASELLDKMKQYLKYKVKDAAVTVGRSPKDVVLTEEQLNNLPELIVVLESEFRPICNNVIKSQMIDQIEDFGKGLSKLAERSGIKYLECYANDVCRLADNFEIDKLLKSLDSFPQIIEELKLKINNL